MPPQLHWLCLDDDPEFVHKSFEQLQSRLAAHGLAVAISPLPVEHNRPIREYLEAGRHDDAAEYLQSLSTRKERLALSVACTPHHAAACAARGRHPLARWGLCTAGILAVTYRPSNKFILWHETLHLLGASDHYDPHTLVTTCGTSTCIMQYAPDETTVDPHACFCPTTLAAIKRFVG